MKKHSWRSFILPLAFSLFSLSACASDPGKPADKKNGQPADGDVVITVPKGFRTSLFANALGRARHIAVSSNGYVYVKLAKKKDGNTILRLKDTNGDGKAEEVTGFGSYTGTGIAIKNGYLYASSDEEVFRYKLDAENKVI